MSVVVVTPPDPIITTEDAKAHLRVDHDEDDALIDALVATATAWLDGPSGGWLGRAIGEQVLELRLDAFPYRDHDGRLPFPPLLSVQSVAYIDPDGTEQSLTSEVYRVIGEGTDSARVVLVWGQSWPAIRYEEEAVNVQYVAGYEEVPSPIRHAILMLVGHLYENREAVNIGNITTALPLSVEALLAPYRIFA